MLGSTAPRAGSLPLPPALRAGAVRRLQLVTFAPTTFG
jgi:hypothetical protein